MGSVSIRIVRPPSRLAGHGRSAVNGNANALLAGQESPRLPRQSCAQPEYQTHLGESRMNTSIARYSVIGIYTLGLAACGGSDAESTETLAKSVESLQCQAPTVTLRQLDEELAKAGVNALKKSCAWDGLAHATQCGSPTSYLRVIEVAPGEAATAQILGYKKTTEYSKVIPLSCPAI